MKTLSSISSFQDAQRNQSFSDIKVIIFDLGSVCIHIDWMKINEEMMRRFKISTLVKSSGNPALIKAYNDALEGKIKTEDFFKAYNSKYSVEEIVSFYKSLYSKSKQQDKKIFDFIKKNKRKVKFACLTDTNTIHFESHKEQKILDNFDYIFASFLLGSRKSDKNTFFKVLSQLKVKPEEVIFVDDNQENIDNASSLGINAIKYENTNKLIKELESKI